MTAERQPLNQSMSVEVYLELERTSQVKHEFVDGAIYAMAGGTIRHDRIANNVRATIDAHLGEGPYVVLGPDVRLRVSDTVYYYPDALVTCAETLSGRDIEIATPRLVVEILSEGTEATDRGEKFANIQTIAGCQEYLLVDSRHRAVECFRRTGERLWVYQRHGPDEHITLESIGLACPVAAFYRRTQV
jgi:Uma2 family endonuclease